MFTKKLKKLLVLATLSIGLSCTAQASLITNIDSDNMFSFDGLATPLVGGESFLSLFPPTSPFRNGTGIFSEFGNLMASYQAYGIQPLELVVGGRTVIDFLFDVTNGFTVANPTIFSSMELVITDFQQIGDNLVMTGTGSFINSSGVTDVVFNASGSNQTVMFGRSSLFASFNTFDVGLADVSTAPADPDATNVDAPGTIGLMSFAALVLLRRKNFLS